MKDRITAPRLAELKREGRKITCVTVYDAYFSRLADEAGIDMLLVGDSLGNVLLGYSTTVPVRMPDMLHHTRAAAQGCQRALLIADLPFGSYQVSVEETLENAIELMKAGAHAVKLEGDYTDRVEALVRAGIPVVGHLGLTPQSVHALGGYRVQGRAPGAEGIIDTALALEAAGCCAIVLEYLTHELAIKVSQALTIPTIGIGAGPGCDGQVQVLHDLLGFAPRTYRHAKPYLQGEVLARDAFKAYAEEVREGVFPTEDQTFH